MTSSSFAATTASVSFVFTALPTVGFDDQLDVQQITIFTVELTVESECLLENECLVEIDCLGLRVKLKSFALHFSFRTGHFISGVRYYGLMPCCLILPCLTGNSAFR